jgi:hypothetical protein
LGKVITDRIRFHTEGWIYAAGYKSLRLSASALDPSKRTRSACEILSAFPRLLDEFCSFGVPFAASLEYLLEEPP